MGVITMINEQLIADALEAGFDFTDNLFCFKELTAFDEIIRKRHEHIRTDNGAVIVNLQVDLDKANAEIARLAEALRLIADGTEIPRENPCLHGIFNYEHCEYCLGDYAEQVLAQGKQNGI
jgi:hypothetical protein